MHEQQARLAELVEQGKALSAETGERLKQVQAVSDDLDRATALKEEILAELARVQDAAARRRCANRGRRRSAQARRDAWSSSSSSARTQLLHTEKKIAALRRAPERSGPRRRERWSTRSRRWPSARRWCRR